MKCRFLVTGLLCFLLSLQLAIAQQKIQGTVVDNVRKTALQGVAVQLVGTQAGTITDVNGHFTLQLPALKKKPESLVLFFSMVGYANVEQTVQLAALNEALQVTMREDLLKLDEVVVTGQGLNVSKRRLSTNVTTISANQL